MARELENDAPITTALDGLAKVAQAFANSTPTPVLGATFTEEPDGAIRARTGESFKSVVPAPSPEKPKG